MIVGVEVVKVGVEVFEIIIFQFIREEVFFVVFVKELFFEKVNGQFVFEEVIKQLFIQEVIKEIISRCDGLRTVVTTVGICMFRLNFLTLQYILKLK